jgi:hypothetical protein
VDKHRLPVTTVAAAQEHRTWLAVGNADARFTFIARGAVQDGDRIVAFTAIPQDPSRPTQITPQSGLHVRLQEDEVGWTNEMAALDLLRMVYEHARHVVIERWFTYGNMPMTLAQRDGLAPPP